MFCPECQEEAEKTNWVPPPGYDPRLGEYHCQRCDTTFYAPGRAKSFKAYNLSLLAGGRENIRNSAYPGKGQKPVR